MKKGCFTMTLILLLVTAIVVIGLAAVTDGFKNWDASTWFKQTEAGCEHEYTRGKCVKCGEDEPAPETPETPQDNGGMLVNKATENGLRLATNRIAPERYGEYGISPLAETAYTIKATVMPSTADNKEVDWSVAWADGSDSWASGKTVTEYVTVTPASDGALSATVACLQEFGAQIALQCASRDNASVKASTTVDYRVRPTGVTLKYEVSGTGDEKEFTDSPATDIISAGTEYVLTPGTTFGTGTVNDYEYSWLIGVRFTDEFAEYMTKHACEKYDYPHFDEAYGTGYSTEYTFTDDYIFSLTEASLVDMNLTYPNNMDGSDFQGVESSIGCFIDGLKHYKGTGGVLLFTVSLICGNDTDFGKYADYAVGLETSALIVHVEDMKLDGNGFIF